MNHGAHWIQIRWGKATYFHAYLDTQRIARSCAEMTDAGIEEAAATPIVDRETSALAFVEEEQRTPKAASLSLGAGSDQAHVRRFATASAQSSQDGCSPGAKE